MKNEKDFYIDTVTVLTILAWNLQKWEEKSDNRRLIAVMTSI